MPDEYLREKTINSSDCAAVEMFVALGLPVILGVLTLKALQIFLYKPFHFFQFEIIRNALVTSLRFI